RRGATSLTAPEAPNRKEHRAAPRCRVFGARRAPTVPRNRPEKGSTLPIALLALALGGFGIGTIEFVAMGILPEVAEAFGVSIPTAGYMISGYALGVVVGAPVLAAAGARLDRKHLLIGLMAAFTLGNLASALAPTF